jgi:hypothetical protein
MIPSDGRVRLPVTSPTSAAFPKRFGGSAYPNLPHKETLCGMSFRDRHYSLRSSLLVCSPPRSPLPLRPKIRTQGSRDFYTRADHALLPMRASGMLAA